MLEFKNITKSFRGPQGQVKALKDVSLSVALGELIVVQGPSGCGKTTLLLIAGGLLKPDAGVLFIEGQDPYTLRPNLRSTACAEKIGFVLKGSIEISVGNGVHRLEEGDSIYYPSHIPHSWRALEGNSIEVIWILTPPSF